MKRSYLDYAMSVIISRALPDVRDGLKPVHRRILFAMNELGLDWNKKYVKSARIVGEVMGKYHPHGNLAIYDALVRLAQDFSMRVPLVDGQGNFGSIDGDPPAAERYTESPSREGRAVPARRPRQRNGRISRQLRRPAARAVRSCRRSFRTCSSTAPAASRSAWRRTFRRTISAKSSTPASPISTIPKSASTSCARSSRARISRPAGIILGRSGILSAYHKGRGSIIMRARVEIENIRKDREALIVTEIPYQVNKRTLIEKIADLVRDKRVEGIADLWDESNREGIRIVIELKRDAVADVVLNNLYKYSDLQTTFGANMLAINGGRPESLI